MVLFPGPFIKKLFAKWKEGRERENLTSWADVLGDAAINKVFIFYES